MESSAKLGSKKPVVAEQFLIEPMSIEVEPQTDALEEAHNDVKKTLEQLKENSAQPHMQAETIINAAAALQQSSELSKALDMTIDPMAAKIKEDVMKAEEMAEKEIKQVIKEKLDKIEKPIVDFVAKQVEDIIMESAMKIEKKVTDKMKLQELGYVDIPQSELDFFVY